MAVAQRRSLVDDVFQDFSHRIGSGELAPGLRLPTEKELALSLNVSRTVIRETMARLTAQGLTIPRQGSGVYVADGARYQAFQVTSAELCDIDDVIRLLEMRLAIETEMASLAAERRTESDIIAIRKCLDAMAGDDDDVDGPAADTAFHRAIAEASGNKYFERFIDFLGVRLVPPRRAYLQNDVLATRRRYLRGIWREHEAIFEAIARGDPRGARVAARRHMSLSLKRHAKRRPATPP